jgi:polar amino acid transport system permease protein
VAFDTHVFWSALTSQPFLDGAVLAVVLAVISQVTATLAGFWLALARVHRSRALRTVSFAYVWFFRAIPTLLILLVVWNAWPQLIPAFKDPWFTPFMAAWVGLSLVETAYMAEVLRGGLMAIDDGQRQAARALGMRPGQVLRKVLLPQMIRVVIPTTANELIGMVKYTSLASVISLRELLTNAQISVQITFRYAEYYAAAIVYYLVIVSVLMVMQARLEKRYRWVSKRRVSRVESDSSAAGAREQVGAL